MPALMSSASTDAALVSAALMSADAALMSSASTDASTDACGTDEFGEYTCISGEFGECCKRSKRKAEMLAKEFEAEREQIMVAEHVRKSRRRKWKRLVFKCEGLPMPIDEVTLESMIE